jgi:DNA-binding MarR family transcriptional regulator
MEDRQDVVDRVRSFNRFYTNVLGLLDQQFLGGPFSLTEVRVLYEIRHTEQCSASKIRANLVIDEGYLSRMIDGFIGQGLVRKRPSPADGRVNLLSLTEKGRREFSRLNDNSNKVISKMIEELSDGECAELAGLMERIRELLGGAGHQKTGRTRSADSRD